MSYKIQITVDEVLNNAIKAGAKQTGLSISSYARLALKKALSEGSNTSLLEQGINDLRAQRVESLSLDDFNKQIDKL